MTFSLSLMRTLASITLVVAAGGIAFAQVPVQKASQNYADAIAQAQVDLDAGRIAEARQKLEATDRSLRGFEFKYLVNWLSFVATGACESMILVIPMRRKSW